MSKYVIDGGTRLKGEVEVFGAKNASFKLMIAALLSDELSRLTNVSYVRDTVVVKQLVESLGGRAEFPGDHVVEVSGQGLNNFNLEQKFGDSSRATSLLIPVLLHRFKKARVPLPGGDKIGARPIDRHLEALQKLGVKIFINNGFIEATCNELIGTEYTFSKNTHTGTEMMILAACLAKGKTMVRSAAAEPEVDDLIAFLNKMGARVKRTEERKIEINGVEKLRGANHQVVFDRNEVVTFACIALGTKGDVVVSGAKKELLTSFLDKVSEASGGWEEVERGLRFYFENELRATNVTTAPAPGFMTDWQPLWTTLMTQAAGESIIHETVFENRFGYVEALKSMGAKIELSNPETDNPDQIYNFNVGESSAHSYHAAKVIGPTALHSTTLEVADIRAGSTLSLAALVADGQSELNNIEMIERGYENLEGRLTKLGARIGKAD